LSSCAGTSGGVIVEQITFWYKVDIIPLRQVEESRFESDNKSDGGIYNNWKVQSEFRIQEEFRSRNITTERKGVACEMQKFGIIRIQDSEEHLISQAVCLSEGTYHAERTWKLKRREE